LRTGCEAAFSPVEEGDAGYEDDSVGEVGGFGGCHGSGDDAEEKPEVEAEEVRELLQSHGLTAEESAPVVEALRRRPEAWRDFMMRFELGLEKPDPARARTSAVVIGGAYVAGGLIPLTPYMLTASARSALPWSVLVTLTALAVFGWVKGNFAGTTPLRSALQTVLIGGLAAGAAFLIARLIA